MEGFPLSLKLLLAVSMAGLSVPGMRGLLDIRAALQSGDLPRLGAPPHWMAARGVLGLLAAVPVYLATASLGAGAFGAALVCAALGYAVAPQFLASLRRHAEQRLLDELALHLDLIALALEAGSSLPAALNSCAERSPPGPLRNAWAAAVLAIHAGEDPYEQIRAIELHFGLRPLSTALQALRNAERAGIAAAPVLRERARQAAAARFARAERQARAAPLRLWATMMLCIAPCTLLVLAFPMARLLALLFD